MDTPEELDVSSVDQMSVSHDFLTALGDAIDLASDQDGVTWLTVGGRRVAAIVPVDVAEQATAFKSMGKAIKDLGIF